MKKLFLLLLFAAPFMSDAQDLGINEEHLWQYPLVPLKPVAEPKRISLRTGVELEYVEQGDPEGIPLVFLHGLGDSWHSFENVLKHLPSDVHVFALSQRGHGNSQKPAEGYAPGDLAEDLAAFIRQKDLGAAVIVGHSMGGVVAQQFAIRYPRLTRGLVIIDSEPVLKGNPGAAEFMQQLEALPKIDREFMTGFQQASLAKPIDSAFFEKMVDEGLKCPLTVFRQVFAGLLEVDFSASLKKIQSPVLIFCGDQDVFCSREGQELLLRNTSRSALQVYEGTGHALHWEEPERFARDLSSFIHNHQNL